MTPSRRLRSERRGAGTFFIGFGISFEDLSDWLSGARRVLYETCMPKGGPGGQVALEALREVVAKRAGRISSRGPHRVVTLEKGRGLR